MKFIEITEIEIFKHKDDKGVMVAIPFLFSKEYIENIYHVCFEIIGDKITFSYIDMTLNVEVVVVFDGSKDIDIKLLSNVNEIVICQYKNNGSISYLAHSSYAFKYLLDLQAKSI